jgi:DNA repair exonuclease SbcCD ATPase subunit
MAGNNHLTTAQVQEINEFRNRLEWLEAERRKQTRKVAELEQKFALQERELKGREERVQQLERQLAAVTSQQARQLQFDTELSQFKDDMVQMIEQYDQRRIQSETEIDRLRRVEYEGSLRELATIRKELPAISRLRQDMELRQAEEARLANLIGGLQGRISAVQNEVETWQREFSFVEEKEKQNGRQIADLQANLPEINKRIDTIYERLELLSAAALRLENQVRLANENQESVREMMKNWLEQVQLGEHERNKQMEMWREVLAEQEDRLRQHEKGWVPVMDQFKEARMVLQTLTDWRAQIEKQQREASELLRVESHRLQSRWDNYRQENDKRWRTFDVEMEQRWSAVNRTDRHLQEQLQAIEGKMDVLEQGKDTLERIQIAQSDAIKKLPRIWLEEVEKAIAQDPNRRRAAALVQVREE